MDNCGYITFITYKLIKIGILTCPHLRFPTMSAPHKGSKKLIFSLAALSAMILVGLSLQPKSWFPDGYLFLSICSIIV